MCGIAGFCNWKTDWEKNIRKMNDRMRHRGPDASGIWASEDGKIGRASCRERVLRLV